MSKAVGAIGVSEKTAYIVRVSCGKIEGHPVCNWKFENTMMILCVEVQRLDIHVYILIGKMVVPLGWYPWDGTLKENGGTPYIVDIYWVYPLLRGFFLGGQTARVPSQGYHHFPYDIHMYI